MADLNNIDRPVMTDLYADVIDTLRENIKRTKNGALPITGGTITGVLNVTGAGNFTGPVTALGGLTANSPIVVKAGAGSDASLLFQDETGAAQGSLKWLRSSDTIDLSGTLPVTINGSTPWTAGNFTPGLYLPLTGGAITGNLSVSGLTTLNNVNATGYFQASGTSALKLPAGTDAQRPGSPNVGDMRYNTTSGLPEIYTAAGAWSTIGASFLPPNYLSGLELSMAGSNSMSLSIGSCKDQSNGVDMYLNAAIINKTQAAFVVGNSQGGKLSAAALANNTTYHWFLLRRASDGLIDMGFDVSTTPTMPFAGSYRRIGSQRTQPSSVAWTFIHQDGDNFILDAPSADYANQVTSASAFNIQTIVPTGIVVRWKGAVLFTNSAAASPGFMYLSAFDAVDVAAAINTAQVYARSANSSGYFSGDIKTNTGAQFRARWESANGNFWVNTHGWIDTRGK